MSASKTSAKQAHKDDARAMALFASRDFLSDLDRVQSIIKLMEEAIALDVKEAKAGDDRIEAWVPEVFAANTLWLLEQMDGKARSLAEHLSAAGINVGERI